MITGAAHHRLGRHGRTRSYGPMNDADFEETFAAVEDSGGDYAGEGPATLTSVGPRVADGELNLSALNYGFVYEIDDANKLVSEEEGYLRPSTSLAMLPAL